MGSRVGMDRMSGTEEDLVVEVEEEEDGETYFRTEHVSRTEELQEEVDMATKVGKKSFMEIYLLIFSLFQEVSILFELLGLSAKESLQCNAGGLLQRIAHLKVAVSALMESSKENVDAVTINGDLEDVEIVHRKTNGNGVHMMDLTAVEALEVKIDDPFKQ